MSEEVKITYRGWAGHFICAYRCQFQLNTLLEYKDTKVVVSTVGRMLKNPQRLEDGFETIGHNRHFETMAFYAFKDSDGFIDAEPGNEYPFSSEWAYEDPEDEMKATKGHWKVVEEIKNNLLERLNEV